MDFIIKSDNEQNIKHYDQTALLTKSEEIKVPANSLAKISFDISAEEKSGQSYYLKPSCNLYFRNYGNGQRRLKVKVINTSFDQTYTVSKGERLFQLVRESLIPFKQADLSTHILEQNDYVNNPNLVFMYNVHETPILNLEQFHDGDAGIDLYCPQEIEILPRHTCFIDFGFWTFSHMNEKIHILPRSSIYKTPLRMADFYKPCIPNSPLILCNGIGLIDGSYRGTIMAFVQNITNNDYSFNIYEQFSLWKPTEKVNSIIVTSNSLSNTSRGAGGFGSTS